MKARKVIKSMYDFGKEWSESKKRWVVDPVRKVKLMVNRITERILKNNSIMEKNLEPNYPPAAKRQWEIEDANLRNAISEIIYKELEPLKIGECAYTHVIHQGKISVLAEAIREYVQTNLLNTDLEDDL